MLDSLPEKEKKSIPLLVGSIKENDGYPLIEEYLLPQGEAGDDG